MQTLFRSLAGLGVAAVATAAAAQITLFDAPRFGGRQFTTNQAISDFADSGFNDRAWSAIIRGGTWQLCTDAYFRGHCESLGPGNYADLGIVGVAGAISSVREVTGLPEGAPAGAAPGGGGPGGGWSGGGPGGGGGWGGGSRAILYENPNFSGRTFVINNQVVSNLDGTGFNDRASSVRVEGGYWIFCSDANFQGECQTFPPGDYPYLSGLNNRISSGRRVSGSFPYNSSPRWSGPR